MSERDALAQLRTMGFPLQSLTEEELDALRGLTSEEIEVLVEVHNRMVAAGPEVQAHGTPTPMTIGGLFF